MATLKGTTINGSLTQNGAILIGSSYTYSTTSQPTALSYGRLQCYGTLNINADTDNSQTEYVILTSGHGCSSSTADGLAVGYDSLTWKNNTIIHSGNIGSQSVSYADNSGALGGYAPSDYYKKYTISIEVGGDASYYYPVYITSPSNKESLNYLCIWKDLGTKTGSYEYNHSNGTSSLYAIYETRTCVWDGNGGYFRTHYVAQPYAPILCHIEPGTSAASGIKVWLRGGGTQYYISTSYSASAEIYYSQHDVGYSPYNQYVAPIHYNDRGSYNGGCYDGFRYYGNANYAYDSDKVDGLHVHSGRNNEANKIVRTDGYGYIQAGYINSSSGDENNASSPARIWGTNGSDSYLRTYRSDYVTVGSAKSVRTYGGDVTLGTGSSSSNDSGDIVYLYGNGNEKSRIWTDDSYGSFKGPNYRCYNSSGGMHGSGTLCVVGGYSNGTLTLY